MAAQQRLEQLRELTKFTEKCAKQLKDIYTHLDWKDDNNTREETVKCPFDSGHKVPLRTLERHKLLCSLKKSGYTPEEQAQMCDPSLCYQNTGVRSFIMGQDEQHQVVQRARASAPLMKTEDVFWQGQFSSGPVQVPQNHKRAICDLTVADRLALYDHVTHQLASQQNQNQTSTEDLYVDLVKKLQKDEHQTEPKSQLELMAEMRDYKRRRQSYRAKNVHITKKSYTEVIREVIGVHSLELARQWSQEVEGGAPACVRSSSSESGQRSRSEDRHKKKHRRSSEHKKKKKKKKKKSRREEDRP